MRSITDRLFRAASEVRARLTGGWRLRALGVTLPVAPGGWSIGYDDAVVIAEELHRFEQRRRIDVLEFGSGVSTFVVLSTLQKKFGDGFRFVSVEADQAWYDTVGRKVATSYRNLDGRFSLVKTDYVTRGGAMTFDLDQLWPRIPFAASDVILVDAPPDTHGEDVRLELCLELLPRLNAKGTLILHDTNRVNELFAFTRLSERFHFASRLETRKGISIFRFPKAPAQ